MAYVFSVQYFENANIVAYVGLRVKQTRLFVWKLSSRENLGTREKLYQYMAMFNGLLMNI